MVNVFKFGGASVKDAEGIKNLARIVELNPEKNLLVVVSAMGKTTNALEELTKAYTGKQADVQDILNSIKNYHESIIKELFEDRNHPVYNEVANTFVEIEWILEEEPHDDFDYTYDQIVSMGELISTRIVSAYLNYSGIAAKWLDARSYIHTDNTYREGKVDWARTQKSIQQNIPAILSDQVAVTQGFIGGTSENFTTTLGREGSDYTAAIFASCLNAEAVTIWKDVPGVLNADPKLFPNTVKYEELSYRDALEMTFYGATVIHPKTIKPLQNSKIPLMVKPFLSPLEPGTCIKESNVQITQPAIILKNNQVLISISTQDLSFITEDHLCDLYGIFAAEHIKVNMMQLSAISYSACVDADDRRLPKLMSVLEKSFKVKYNTGLQLLTIRHFNKEVISQLTASKTVILEQISRHTAQMVLRDAQA
ncbi:aspartate kinase [Paradesertivirga mongoliensis]|uniref:Aspartokinase n=1 Tax=Paradesertivirga mongoliensis TaxID=2100740 RepID=A0ABW4ZRR2_9SPHI|nr:aspartate kinase [Pedobacter mongoliensis]